MIVGPINPRPKALAMGGASTRAISSQKIACCIKVAMRPPYSLGQETAAHPPSWSRRCQVLRFGNYSSSGFSRQLLQSLGALISSHDRNSSRKATSSPVRFRSIPVFCSFVGPRTAHHLFCVTRVAWPCRYFLRKSLFSTFPVPVFGRLSKNSTERGHL